MTSDLPTGERIRASSVTARSRSCRSARRGARFVVVLLACSGTNPAARATSLADALAETYQTNPQLLAARSQLRETDEDVPQALSGWRPHVTVDAAIGPALRQNSIDLKEDPEHLTPQDYQLTVTQNLYTSDRVLADVKRSRAEVAVGRAVLATDTNDVLLAAATAYADVARDREILRLQGQELDVLDRTLASAGVQVAAGAVTEADRQVVRARTVNQRSAVAEATAILSSSEARYEQQIGAVPDNVALPDTPPRLPASEDDALGRAEAANPALVAARDAVAVSRLGVDLAIDQLLPNISLEAIALRRREYEYESHAQSQNEAEGLVVLTVPLYQGGLLYSRIRQAKEGNVHAQDLVDVQQREARQLTITAWTAVEAARIRVVDGEQAVAADRIAEDGIARQQQVGARTFIDVLIAEQDTLASAVALVSARHDLVVDAVGLLAVTGPIRPADLTLPVAPYDPAAHFDRVHEKWAGTAPPPARKVAPKGPIHAAALDDDDR